MHNRTYWYMILLRTLWSDFEASKITETEITQLNKLRCMYFDRGWFMFLVVTIYHYKLNYILTTAGTMFYRVLCYYLSNKIQIIWYLPDEPQVYSFNINAYVLQKTKIKSSFFYLFQSLNWTPSNLRFPLFPSHIETFFHQ